MKESQIIQERIASLENDLAIAKQVLANVRREEAVTGTVDERREYAIELYRRILFDFDGLGYDVDSDVADEFVDQVVSIEEMKAICAGHGQAVIGSIPVIQACKAETLDAIIKVLETCIEYIEGNYVLNFWMSYDPVQNVIFEDAIDAE